MIGYCFGMFLVKDCKYGKIGYCVYKLFASFTLIFWYWSLFGEQWLFQFGTNVVVQKEEQVIPSNVNNNTLNTIVVKCTSDDINNDKNIHSRQPSSNTFIERSVLSPDASYTD